MPATYDDITEALVVRVAAHHDADHTVGCDFEGSNGLVLRTESGWKIYPGSVDDRIRRAVRSLKDFGGASLPVGDGKFFMLVSIKEF
ncbi:MAG TPA: hypothetical protein VMR98_04005 [Candidatus Polarisedimenticolaceae bacterium]|nr:hypothetical protein [Candidatus Polarisedimenticolaceae bacterium]